MISHYRHILRNIYSSYNTNQHIATNLLAKNFLAHKVIKRTLLSRVCFTSNRLYNQNFLMMHSHSRPLKIYAGKFKDKTPTSLVPSINNENPEKVQSDQTGFHKVVGVESCANKQCHNKICDTIHEKTCSVKNKEYVGVSECAGTLTHKIPKDKNGVELSPEDINGETKYGSQKLVTEKTTVPLDKSKVKEHENATEYVQQQDITKKIVESLPSNSPLNLKNTSENHIANDEDL